MIGTVVVGYYSNYFMITSQVNVIYMLIMTAVSAGVGNVIAKESQEHQVKIYNKLSLITFFYLFAVHYLPFPVAQLFYAYMVGTCG